MNPFSPTCKKRKCLCFSNHFFSHRPCCTFKATRGGLCAGPWLSGLFRAEAHSNYLVTFTPRLVSLWLLAAFVLGHHTTRFLFPTENYADVFKHSETLLIMALSVRALSPHVYLAQPDGEQTLTSTAIRTSTHDIRANTKVRLNWKEGKGPFHQWSNWQNDLEETNLPAAVLWRCSSLMTVWGWCFNSPS